MNIISVYLIQHCCFMSLPGWWHGVVCNAFRMKQSHSMPGPVSTAMGDYGTGTAIGFRASREH